MKAFDSSKIDKILVITLSNIGDVILTFPVIDILRENFPMAKMTIVIGPKAAPLLEENINVEDVQIFDKKQSVGKTIGWLQSLRNMRYDLVVDLRNSAIPFFVGARYRTTYRIRKHNNQHMRLKHLKHLQSVYPDASCAKMRYAIFISEANKTYVNQVMNSEIGIDQKFVVMAPGAAAAGKRWAGKEFALLGDKITQVFGRRIVFVGDQNDRAVTEKIITRMHYPSVNLCGRLSLVQLAELLNHCDLAVMNDSAPMHLASYLDRPVIALFGPTDPALYGPWSSKSLFFKNPEMDKITGDQVFHSIKMANDRLELDT